MLDRSTSAADVVQGASSHSSSPGLSVVVSDYSGSVFGAGCEDMQHYSPFQSIVNSLFSVVQHMLGPLQRMLTVDSSSNQSRNGVVQ